MMSTSEQHVLNFWRNVEVFDLPQFNKDSYPLIENSPLPWLQGERPARKNYVWQYTLLFGKLDKKKVVEKIDALLEVKDAQPDWERSVTGDTCLAAILLDDEGRPDERSYVLASYIAGMQVLEQNKNCEEVSSLLNTVQEDFELRYNIPPIPENKTESDEKPVRKGKVVTWELLHHELDYLQKQIQAWSTEPIKTFLIAKEVHKNNKLEVNFLNSFYLDDLNHLCSLDSKNYNRSLQEYLNLKNNENQRKDVLANRKHFFDCINPKNMPAGKWPSSPSYSLYTAQAAAVNNLFSALEEDGGIRGINGPPGTGKTTLLLDVVAEVIVKRAMQMMKLGCDNIFHKKYEKIEKDEGFAGYFLLNKKLINQYGIVVASNNNAAVENITKELPSLEKIDGKAFPHAAYFTEQARYLTKTSNWGTLSAALGNAENRKNFRDTFWKSDADKNFMGFHDLLYNVYRNKENDQSEIHRANFETTKEKLTALLKSFNVFQQKATAFHNGLAQYQKDVEEKASLEQEVISLDSHKEVVAEKSSELGQQITERASSIQSLQTNLQLLQTTKPAWFFFQKLFKTSSYQQWKTKVEQYLDQFDRLQLQCGALRKEQQECDTELLSIQTKLQQISKQLDALKGSISLYLDRQEELHTFYGIADENLVDTDFVSLPMNEIHKRMPYHSAQIAQLRSEIFLLSIELHQHAIMANAKYVRNNLSLFFEMLSGYTSVREDIVNNLWSTFFLCVPVVSTTLASVSRLFPNKEKDQIGWLLIDEAGQATPQSAAGIINRSKRCVIVGDPLQVEPVVTIPKNLVYKLMQQEKVDKIWSPVQTSVQQLADRISVNGTYMPLANSDEQIWTGFPLRTHRRCDNPMFDIANKIAYDGQMVKDTKDDTKNKFIGNSTWFHVEGTNLINKHTLKGEIELLKIKIQELKESKYQGEIFIISPFSLVADFCEWEFHNDPKISCGTIHKFQGKEADIVFLVLGSDPKSPGARNWASEKPNMLNVALTRAKKRIYVIGNKNLWGQCDFYKDMCNAL
ncbi:DEAD/DEAH box helicase [Chryseobacterium rhizosphaerae]|nr:AAA domain-containing protein [Chryseobacterium rhizosphaerae]GEN66264.1 ATP-binding protein [Chryseobacterium rhizosphaerae]